MVRHNIYIFTLLMYGFILVVLYLSRQSVTNISRTTGESSPCIYSGLQEWDATDLSSLWRQRSICRGRSCVYYNYLIAGRKCANMTSLHCLSRSKRPQPFWDKKKTSAMCGCSVQREENNKKIHDKYCYINTKIRATVQVFTWLHSWIWAS